ncbi:MAG: hypothetical protein A2Y76_05285 [Planctomycetes bacterium RBG_13_60_9]|nr:MAG: hypothetical protein A2Y76_05285 [Planctomycetes bacterium RBG_13_60_9]
MGPREKERVLQLCREVDLLVTLDPGASDVGVLERARCKMNELVREEDLSAAEEVALAITQLHAGVDADEYVRKYGLR